ncbi:NHLP bacteriocin system secretion protein [Paenibacillus glycinis]|uniref:NHLP bacteriocin system secretion protein n=1 Tax=Paenibacillus glycinis TaxID=2697035 RepID=A0ABW9XS44_9BACL|nr:NHLP bacteriocin system secretion protein [Paenibacillus glycinis]NBD25152.1 NHLP bacteriocin system secretion protein [Paenibacillus glycinis]
MKTDVFRKVSVERLSSPEQLDTLMKVTSPKGWLALVALGVLLASAIAWGFGGTMSTKIGSQGVLIRPGGLQNIFSEANGTLTDIRVVENDYVNKGDVVARIEQPALLGQLGQLEQSLQAAEAGYKQEPTAVLSAQIEGLRSAIDSARSDYANATRIVSPYTGRVLEVRSKLGATIGAGMPLLTIESGDKQAKALQAVLYLSLQEGKTILPGMQAEIAPSSVNREEFGFIRGRVTSVSEFPVTAQAMLVTLGNEALVGELSGRAAALLEVRIEPILDPRTVSGYKWSTGEGPPVEIDSGTLMSASIIVKQQKPITSVIPQIK